MANGVSAAPAVAQECRHAPFPASSLMAAYCPSAAAPGAAQRSPHGPASEWGWPHGGKRVTSLPLWMGCAVAAAAAAAVSIRSLTPGADQCPEAMPAVRPTAPLPTGTTPPGRHAMPTVTVACPTAPPIVLRRQAATAPASQPTSPWPATWGPARSTAGASAPGVTATQPAAAASRSGRSAVWTALDPLPLMTAAPASQSRPPPSGATCKPAPSVPATLALGVAAAPPACAPAQPSSTTLAHTARCAW